MKHLKKYESPDLVIKDDGTRIFWNKSGPAYAFGYGGEWDPEYQEYDEKMMVGRQTHGDLVDDGREEMSFPGRIWTNRKLISFWEYPRNYEELRMVLDDLEEVLGIDIEDDWDIEIVLINGEQDDPDDKYWDEIVAEEDRLNLETRIIKVGEYMGSEKRSEEELKQIHLLEPEEKAKALKDAGYEFKQKHPVEFRHALGNWRGENKNYDMKYLKSYENYNNDMVDWIITNYESSDNDEERDNAAAGLKYMECNGEPVKLKPEEEKALHAAYVWTSNNQGGIMIAK